MGHVVLETVMLLYRPRHRSFNSVNLFSPFRSHSAKTLRLYQRGMLFDAVNDGVGELIYATPIVHLTPSVCLRQPPPPPHRDAAQNSGEAGWGWCGNIRSQMSSPTAPLIVLNGVSDTCAPCARRSRTGLVQCRTYESLDRFLQISVTIFEI